MHPNVWMRCYWTVGPDENERSERGSCFTIAKTSDRFAVAEDDE